MAFFQFFCLVLALIAPINLLCGNTTHTFSIDVVIPAIAKDKETLDAAIDGIRAHCKQVRRVYVISPTRLTHKAKWIAESRFPFTIKSVAKEVAQGNATVKRQLFAPKLGKAGWYLQQLLKLYAYKVIPGIGSNILILDADTIFLNPVEFIDAQGHPLYNVGTEYHAPYFQHASRLLPGLARLFPEHSGICHHMLFQKPILDALFMEVEGAHKTKFWKAFCRSVTPSQRCFSGASEYEIYFNYVFSKFKIAKLRRLRWSNEIDYKNVEYYRTQGYTYVSFHNYLRDPTYQLPPP
jgi:hypothetical protein